MDIIKQADMGQTLIVEERDLALINRWSRKVLTAEEVYAFAVRLCDNEIDRDGERFTEETLEELAKLFEGKSGIFDHQWSAKEQTARIYRTELVREEGIPTLAGEPYRYLKGYAYMLRSEKNRDLIEEIEAGIKREVSVGCAVERSVCSICGGDIATCGHVKGREYSGKCCWADLTGAKDAFEWSFVAVPAQPRAGVLKSMGQGNRAMKRMEYEAALGRKYLSGLRKEVARLGRLVVPEVDGDVMASIAEKLGEEDLSALKKGFEIQLDRARPTGPQLSYRTATAERAETDGAFLI